MKFKDKFIGYIDILGFKNLVEAAEDGTGMPLPQVLNMLTDLGSSKDRRRFSEHGPSVCPKSTYLQRDLDFRLTQISDCVIVSSEVSPAGVINLIHHCWGAVISLLYKGLMCRGYITRGLVYHTDTQIIGSGYQEALSKEEKVIAFKHEADERGTPFVEVDLAVCNYVRSCGNECVKEMFCRFVKDDGVVSALFPFKRFFHSFFVGGFGIHFDPKKEKCSNQKLRLLIENLKERVMLFVDKSNPSAVRKAEYYIQALNAQLAVCDRTDEIIGM